MIVEIPLRLVNSTNAREHWAARAKRAKRDREAAYLATRKAALPCVVTITRIGKRMMDDDNVRAACKSIRDGIALRLGVDDADPRVTWRYRQETAREYSVRIEIDDA